MKKFALYILLIVVAAAIGIPTFFLVAHVINDSASLYGIAEISALPKSTIIFFLLLIQLLRTLGPLKDNENEKSIPEKLKDTIAYGIAKVLVVLICWASFYLIHLFL